MSKPIKNVEVAKLTNRQKKAISKLYIAALIESTGDAFIDEIGVHKLLSLKDSTDIHNYSRSIADKLRGNNPSSVRDIHEIVEYVLTGKKLK